jgi:hypothetical protein
MLLSQLDHLVFEVNQQLLLSDGSFQLGHLLFEGKDLLGVTQVFHDQAFWFGGILPKFRYPAVNRRIGTLVGSANFGNGDQAGFQFLDFGLPETLAEMSPPALLQRQGKVFLGAHMLGFK